MFEKKIFTEPECEVEHIAVADVITTSGEGSENPGFEGPDVEI